MAMSETMAAAQQRLAAVPQVRVVASFAELVATPFRGEINALCWPRELPGDFGEIEQALPDVDAITSLDPADLRALPLSAAGQIAREQLIADQALLSARGLQPSLDLVPPADPPGRQQPVRTDVGDWHVDSATAETDTYLCSYFGATTEGILNAHATCQVDVPATRASLRQSYGSGGDDESFRTWLTAHFYDLHYAPLPDATTYSFGLGHLWRIATQHPGSQVPPCIHRAPSTSSEARRRLLLIS
jgi:hypothetical protein